ncbi:MAG: hypothetical protein JSR46_06160 [Verrucomicrobia bacterium]|nr:hypothetical protein [Verrucomicrobiota bacterium]
MHYTILSLMILFAFPALQAKETKKQQESQISLTRSQEEIRAIASQATYSAFKAYDHYIQRDISIAKAPAIGQWVGNVNVAQANAVIPYIRVVVDEIAPVARRLKRDERETFWETVQIQLTSHFCARVAKEKYWRDRVSREVSSQVNLKKIQDF